MCSSTVESNLVVVVCMATSKASLMLYSLVLSTSAVAARSFLPDLSSFVRTLETVLLLITSTSVAAALRSSFAILAFFSVTALALRLPALAVILTYLTSSTCSTIFLSIFGIVFSSWY